MNIKEIAKLAGVSVATVSRVINDSNDVTEETKEKVRKVISEHNYEPDFIAKSLRGGKTDIFGVIFLKSDSDLNDSYSAAFLMGVLNYMLHHGKRTIVEASYKEDKLKAYKKLISSSLVDGFILLDLEDDDERVKYLKSINIPFVVVGQNSKNDFIFIDTDNTNGGYLGIKSLYSIGCRSILYISGTKGPCVSSQRLDGVKKACGELGISADIQYGDFEKESGYRIAKATQLIGYDGIFCASDFMAYGVMEFMKEKKISLPIIGFDDLSESKILGLTSIRQDIRNVGYLCASKLNDIILGKEVSSQILPVECIERSSTKNFRKSQK